MPYPEKKTSWQSCLQSRAADPWTNVFDFRGCFWRCIRHTEMPLKTRKQRSFIPLMLCHFNEQHIINRRIDALWCRIPSHHSLHIYILYIIPLMREHTCVYLMEWPMLPMSPHQRLVGSYGPEGWVVPNNFTEKNDVREIHQLLDVPKALKRMVDKLPISTVFFSGCLNHQQYHQMLSVYQLPWHGLVYRWSRWTPHTPLLWRQVLGLRGCSGATLGCGRWWLSGCSWGRVEDGTGKMVRLLWRFVMFCSYLFPLTLKHSSIYQLLSMWKHRCPKWGVTLKLPLVCWIWFDSISCSRSLCWFVTRYPWLQQKFLGGFFLNCRKDAKIYFECLLRCWKFVLSKSCRSFSIKYGIHAFSI